MFAKANMRRNRVDPKTFDLSTPSTLCGAKLHPSEAWYVDGERIHCPKCGRDFVPERKRATVSFGLAPGTDGSKI
jgi:hypothetical protein